MASFDFLIVAHLIDCERLDACHVSYDSLLSLHDKVIFVSLQKHCRYLLDHTDFSFSIFQANGTFIVQPKSTHIEGVCQATKANLTIEFKEGFITFMFNKV